MTDFNIAEVTVTHTYHYEPSDYLNYCDETNTAPSLEGYIEFIWPEIQADFPNSNMHTYEVTYTES